MDAIILSLAILGIILFLGLIGWIIEKYSNSMEKQNNFCVMIKNLIREQLHWVLLFLLFLTLIQSGIENIIKIFSSDDEEFFPVALTISVMLVAAVFYFVNNKNTLINALTVIVRLSAANDKDFLHKLAASNPGNFSESRDIPLSLILDKKGETFGFIDRTEPTTQHNYLERSILNRQPEPLDIANKTIQDLGTKGNIYWDRVYNHLTKLDIALLSLVPANLIKDHPRYFYFIRLNFLEDFIPFIINGKFPNLDIPKDEEDKFINDLCKASLNKVYTDPNNKMYTPSTFKKYNESFNINEFEAFLHKTNPR